MGKKKGRNKKGKKIKRFSGHGDVHYKILGKRQLKELKATGHTYVTINGVKKKVTPGNLTRHNGKVAIGWYRRSDTGKIALRQFARDRSIPAGHRKGWSPQRSMETDRKNSGGI